MSFLWHVAQWFFTLSHWRGTTGTPGIPHLVLQHVTMAAMSVVAAAAVALPIAFWLGHIGKGSYAAISIANAGRAIPSFALLVLGVVIFRLRPVPMFGFGSVPILGFGSRPILLALWALSVPPILTNAYTGIRQVDPDVAEAAAGMGLTGWQVLSQVEVPIAVPLIFAGIRTAAVQAVATATLGAVVGWGGVGVYIVGGISQQDHVKVFAGALIVAVMSFLTEIGLAGLQRALTPDGLKFDEGLARQASVLPGAAAAPLNQQVT